MEERAVEVRGEGFLELQKNDNPGERETKKETREERITEKPGTERGREERLAGESRSKG